MAAPVLARGIQQQDMANNEVLETIRNGTEDLAKALGMEDGSDLKPEAHQRLAGEVEKLAAAGAKLGMQAAATTKAMRAVASEFDSKRGSGSRNSEKEEVDMADVVRELKAKVESAMKGVDARALESPGYKDIVKLIRAVEDDDVVIDPTSSAVSLICPLTAQTIEDPVRSKICKHSYTRKAIIYHIKIQQGNAPCPVAACMKRLTIADLEADKGMQRRLRIERQTQPTQPDDDAEELDDEPMGETEI